MNRIDFSHRMPGPRDQRGQGMTEYIVIVALVAIAAIGAFSANGCTMQNQVASVANGLAGKRSIIVDEGGSGNLAEQEPTGMQTYTILANQNE